MTEHGIIFSCYKDIWLKNYATKCSFYEDIWKKQYNTTCSFYKDILMK